ncbi:MAG: hypothetical protein INR62_14175 [Rhodospirillales bacterium]|nr:hypothetical protein [Acetobacter sp.]
MAIGDAAAAKGLSVVPATKNHGLGYQDINQVTDYVANEIDARTSADNLKFDAAKIIISSSTPAIVNGAIWFKPVS